MACSTRTPRRNNRITTYNTHSDSQRNKPDSYTKIQLQHRTHSSDQEMNTPVVQERHNLASSYFDGISPDNDHSQTQQPNRAYSTNPDSGGGGDEVVVSPWVKTSVFLGVFLLRFLSGVPYVWGSLTVYVNSYYCHKGDYSAASFSSWLMSMEIFGFTTGLILGNALARKIGLRTLLFLGLMGFNVAIFLSYVTLQHSVIGLCVTFGLVTGFSGGLTESVQLALIVRWTKRYHGLSTSSVQSSQLFGAVALNFFLTLFINPKNEDANSVEDHKPIFTQPDVVDRVPFAFLLYGAISLVLNFTGFILVRDKPGRSNIVLEIFHRLNSKRKPSPQRLKLINSENSYSDSKAEKSVSFLTSLNPQSGISTLHQDHETDAIVTEDIKTTDCCDNYIDRINTISDTDSSNPNTDQTPGKVIKTPSFYALLMFKATQIYSFFILNTYYKTFGLISIPDDYFLTVAMTVQCLLTPLFSWVSGWAIDKHGVKPTLTTISSLFCILFCFFYPSHVNPWLYFVTCVFCGCALFSLFSVTSAVCVKLYGESHFTTIYGMTLIPGYALTPLLPPLTEWVIATLGWFPLFISVASVALLNVIALLWGLPR